MIQFDQVGLRINKRTLFKDFSATVQQGEMLCISGASGSGKSCLLQLLLGELQPTQGQILYKGQKLQHTQNEIFRQQVTWLPQNYDLPIKDIEELHLNLPFPKQTFGKLSHQLGLSDGTAQRPWQQLSGGEKQRLLLAVCFSFQTPVYVLDEPTASLDRSATELLIQYIGSQTNACVVSTSHDPLWIQQADKVIAL